MVKPWSRLATSLTGTVQPFGGERNEPGARRQLSLRAEGAADKGADDANLSGVDAELLGHAVLEPIDELARLINGQPVVVPGAGRGEELDRIVVLGGRRIFRIDGDVGRRQRRLDVAGGRRFLDPLGDLGRVVLGQPLRAEGRARRCRGVGHAYPAGGLPRRFEGIGENDGDDLAVVVDLGAELLRRCRSAAECDGLEVARVLVGEDLEHAGHRAALRRDRAR